MVAVTRMCDCGQAMGRHGAANRGMEGLRRRGDGSTVHDKTHNNDGQNGLLQCWCLPMPPSTGDALVPVLLIVFALQTATTATTLMTRSAAQDECGEGG